MKREHWCVIHLRFHKESGACYKMQRLTPLPEEPVMEPVRRDGLVDVSALPPIPPPKMDGAWVAPPRGRKHRTNRRR